MVRQRSCVPILVIVLLYCLPPRTAVAVPAYSFGASLDNTVVPGSIVSIEAAIRNTGTDPIVFPFTFSGGLPSAQGGSLPFGGGLGFQGGDWQPVNFTQDFFGPFEGVTIAPGATFEYLYGTFEVPAGLAPGASVLEGIGIGIDFTDTIIGNLFLVAGIPFDNFPILRFTIGETASKSPLSFFDALVVDRSSGQILSGPPGFPAPVPAPSTASLLASGLAALGGIAWRQHRWK